MTLAMLLMGVVASADGNLPEKGSAQPSIVLSLVEWGDGVNTRFVLLADGQLFVPVVVGRNILWHTTKLLPAEMDALWRSLPLDDLATQDETIRHEVACADCGPTILELHHGKLNRRLSVDPGFVLDSSGASLRLPPPPPAMKRAIAVLEAFRPSRLRPFVPPRFGVTASYKETDWPPTWPVPVNVDRNPSQALVCLDGREFEAALAWVVMHQDAFIQQPVPFEQDRWLEPNCRSTSDGAALAASAFASGPRFAWIWPDDHGPHHFEWVVYRNGTAVGNAGEWRAAVPDRARIEAALASLPDLRGRGPSLWGVCDRRTAAAMRIWDADGVGHDLVLQAGAPPGITERIPDGEAAAAMDAIKGSAAVIAGAWWDPTSRPAPPPRAP